METIAVTSVQPRSLPPARPAKSPARLHSGSISEERPLPPLPAITLTEPICVALPETDGAAAERIEPQESPTLPQLETFELGAEISAAFQQAAAAEPTSITAQALASTVSLALSSSAATPVCPQTPTLAPAADTDAISLAPSSTDTVMSRPLPVVPPSSPPSSPTLPQNSGLQAPERHLKRRSMLHRPYVGVKLASELESARVVAYERREDGCFWYTLHVTPMIRFMPPPPQKPRYVLRPQPYAIYRICDDFVELSLRLAHTFNMDASGDRPLAPLLESFTRAQQRNAHVPFDMMDQLDSYMARLIASDQQVQQSRPFREFLGIWRSDVDYKVSRSVEDPLARAFALGTLADIEPQWQPATEEDVRHGMIQAANRQSGGVMDISPGTNVPSLPPSPSGTHVSFVDGGQSKHSSRSSANTGGASPTSPRRNVLHPIQSLKRSKSMGRLVQRAKAAFLRKRPSAEDSNKRNSAQNSLDGITSGNTSARVSGEEAHSNRDSIEEVVAASTLRHMRNGSVGVVAITTAPWNRNLMMSDEDEDDEEAEKESTFDVGAQDELSPNGTLRDSALADFPVPPMTPPPPRSNGTTQRMPELVRIGSVRGTASTRVGAAAGSTMVAPWNQKLVQPPNTSPRRAQRPLLMSPEKFAAAQEAAAADRHSAVHVREWSAPPASLSRSQSMLEHGAHATGARPHFSLRKALAARAAAGTHSRTVSDASVVSRPVSAASSAIDAASTMSGGADTLTSNDSATLEVAEANAMANFRPISGSAMAAVAVRAGGGEHGGEVDAAVIRRPLVRAITLAGLRRKRTQDKLKQEAEAAAAAATTTIEMTEEDIAEETVVAASADDQDAGKVVERNTSIRWKTPLDMSELRRRLPVTSPCTPNVPVTPYEPNNAMATEADAPAAESRSRSAGSSPTASSYGVVGDASLSSLAAVAAHHQRQSQLEQADGQLQQGGLTRHRSQPGIRDSVLIQRTEMIAPRPTPAQLARARTIAHAPSDTFVQRRRAAAAAASTAAARAGRRKQMVQVLPDDSAQDLIDLKVVLDQTRLIKLQIPRQITFDELRTRIEDKFRRCGHGDAVLEDRVLVYREQAADGAIVRLEGDFALGVVLFECPERTTFFAV
ncbi:hypothetical protein THASP1DRAFT_29612 [Thamnocephalis sphaerospora]|uniref:Uncharacterized protein n=1 Tax=Thamnocephalis sphaerospora TaxID=78915 RepID=A0A4P9XR88_9FUNG|nr:hypothetical protein THASP1DRAFT_29612 [Thamnocephalis sphaerospora]|eukprot:RKP08585.1 hypothetical protein THASP1DRAFT_29612 [Thamnocephalis sphaerospora]